MSGFCEAPNGIVQALRAADDARHQASCAFEWTNEKLVDPNICRQRCQQSSHQVSRTSHASPAAVRLLLYHHSIYKQSCMASANLATQTHSHQQHTFTTLRHRSAEKERLPNVGQGQGDLKDSHKDSHNVTSTEHAIMHTAASSKAAFCNKKAAVSA